MSHPRVSKNSSRTEKSGLKSHKITSKTKRRARAKKKRRKKKSLRQANVSTISKLNPLDEEQANKDHKEGPQSTSEKVKGFFFEPEGGNPRPEGWVAALLAAGTLYYIINHKKPMKEIIYMDFLNNYLI